LRRFATLLEERDRESEDLQVVKVGAEFGVCVVNHEALHTQVNYASTMPSYGLRVSREECLDFDFSSKSPHMVMVAVHVRL
jgi:hypothetical protein